MNNQGERNGRDRGTSLFSYVGVRRRDNAASSDGLSADRLEGLVSSVDSIPAAPTIDADAQQAEAAERVQAQAEAKAAERAEAEAEAEAVERAEAEAEAADESGKSALDFTDPAATNDEGRSTAEVGEAGAVGLDAVAHMLALAQKLHDEYVFEGQSTRESLIGEAQSRYDQVVGEATARREELLSTGQAKHDEFVSAGEAKHDEFVSAGEAKHDALIAEAEARLAEANAEHEHVITEARTRSTGMVAEAQQKRAEVLQGLDRERSLLQKEIEELRTFERDHRARLKSYLEGQLIELEQTGPAETG